MANGVRCPYCGASRIHKDGYTDKGAAKYHCLNCHEYLNDLTNPVLAFVREVQEVAEKIENKVLCQKEPIKSRYEKDA
ncbi:IS1 family transposase [Methanophagales archaeon]|nr:MAG: IS1 family transposase [Methanophagales archaeon]